MKIGLMLLSFSVCLLLGAGIAYLPFVAMAPIVLPIFALLVQSPFCLLLCFVAVLYLRPGDFSPAIAVLQPGKLFIVGALFLWILKKGFLRSWARVHSRQNFWMLWLTISVFLSSVLGSNPAESLQVFRDVFFKILLLFFLLQNMLTSKERLVSFAVVQSVLCAALGLYAVVSKVSGNANIEGSRAALVGLLGDPNDLALILLMPIHFLFFFAKDGSGLRRVLAGIGFSLCILGVMSTLSRGGMLGLAGGMALSLRSFIKSKLVIAGLLFAGLLIFVIGSGVSDRRSGAIGGDEIDESAQGRLDAWKAGGRMLVRHPVLGVGLQRFADNFDRFSNNPVFWGRHETHNSYIKVAAETGFMGLIPFAALILRSLLQARRLNRRTPSSEKSEGESAIRKSSFSNIAGFCVAAFFLSQCWGWFFFIFFVYIDRCESILSSTPNLPGAKGNRQMAGGRCGIS